MKHRKTLMVLLVVGVFTQAIGAALNRVEKLLNQGMPAPGYTVATGNYVPINRETKLVFLGDVIRVGNYALSIGDLFLITGMFTCFIALWIAFPQGRKFFPILIVSVIGVYSCIAQQCPMACMALCESAAIGSIIAMYWSYRSGIKKKATLKE